jgi:hypothetical protein
MINEHVARAERFRLWRRVYRPTWLDVDQRMRRSALENMARDAKDKAERDAAWKRLLELQCEYVQRRQKEGRACASE